MAGIKIYEWDGSTSGYIIKHTADHCDSFEVNKSSGIIPFSLPIVNTDLEVSGRISTEKTDLIRITGAESTINMRFEVDMNQINTMLSFVSNKMGKKHKIDVEDWSGQTSGITFIGLIDSVSVSQRGGDARLNCNMRFYEGDNIFWDVDL